MINIRVLKICVPALYKRLEIIYKSSFENGLFPAEWKKTNVVSVYKNRDKQDVQISRSILLLLICGKDFEWLTYNKMFEFLMDNDLISQYQLGVQPGDSCGNQLLSITHDIYKSLDVGLELRAVFLDTSKAFDKMWEYSLIFKLKESSVSDVRLTLLKDFLSDRKQRLLLNSQNSSWVVVKARVSQSSIIRSLLFLIYINYLPDNLLSSTTLLTDNTLFFSIVHGTICLSKMMDWAGMPTLSICLLTWGLQPYSGLPTTWAFSLEIELQPRPQKTGSWTHILA